jgi:glutamate N-acetyltransferase/amino-acid N-acetyltransferase
MTEKTITTLTEFKWPQGFASDGVHAGLRKERKDMGWLYSQVPAQAAGCYTTNQFQAAPTALTKKTINSKHELQAMVMNSANANSCTGEQGEKDAATMQAVAAKKLGIAPELVGVASTGLIGANLPMDIVKAGIAKMELTQNTAVTEAILTTDLHPKTITVTCEVGGKTVTISGFCKGSGMIHPKMATMLGFVTSDAKIAGTQLQALLSHEVDSTFNQITVDGDTSTNDMVVVLANGLADNPDLTPDQADYSTFATALHQVLAFLAQAIAADGEGATKLVEANVKGAANGADGQKVAKAIVGSNLLKAAIFGEDANWGRVMSAIGQTDAQVDIHHVYVWLNGLALVENSRSAAFDESEMKKAMQAKKIVLDVDLHSGDATGQAWGCDLTYKYVQINASYRN